MAENSTAQKRSTGPFTTSGGLSLFASAAVNLAASLANLSIIAKYGPSTQSLAIGAANLILTLLCGGMWLQKYYLPSRRRNSAD